MRRRQMKAPVRDAYYERLATGISGDVLAVPGSRDREQPPTLPSSHGGLRQETLDDGARHSIAFRARKLGITVEFVEFTDPLPGWCRYQRVRCGDRTGVIDTAVSPRAYEAALVAFAKGETPAKVA
jgi:hypothetical protein